MWKYWKALSIAKKSQLVEIEDRDDENAAAFDDAIMTTGLSNAQILKFH